MWKGGKQAGTKQTIKYKKIPSEESASASEVVGYYHGRKCGVSVVLSGFVCVGNNIYPNLVSPILIPAGASLTVQPCARPQ